MSLEVGLFGFIFDGKKGRPLKEFATLDADDDIVQVLTAVSEGKRPPKDIAFDWITPYEEEGVPTKADCHSPSVVRSTLQWFVAALVSKEGLPAAEKTFPFPNTTGTYSRRYKAYVAHLTDQANDWITYCDYAAKSKALIALYYI